MEEKLKEKIKKFLSLEIGDGYGYGYGYGYGSGFGDGDGYGFGDGFGDGYGSGFGDGYGSGDGFGYGCGFGYGSGCGSGDGSGFGDGDGSGFGDGLLTFNNRTIYMIDGVQTIITQVFKQIAKGFILNSDFTLEPCYIAKGHSMFAHGETSRKAMQALQEKIFENIDTEEAIEEFRKKFKNNKKYKGTEFYSWHHILTGSCEMGRNNFIKNHNIDLENQFTVKEFIELTENAYGGEIIQQLKEFYK